MSRRIVLMTLLVLSAALPAMARQAAAEESPAAPDPMEGVKIRELLVNGSIDGTNIDFVIEFDVETTQTARRFPLIRGDAVLQSIEVTGADHRL
ncbi:MAG: hypothetical protein MI802_08805, partial [Desulfobacterales bacterium]|nr:hypothetical protein [Desulfobacterales bacterium]